MRARHDQHRADPPDWRFAPASTTLDAAARRQEGHQSARGSAGQDAARRRGAIQHGNRLGELADGTRVSARTLRGGSAGFRPGAHARHAAFRLLVLATLSAGVRTWPDLAERNPRSRDAERVTRRDLYYAGTRPRVPAVQVTVE